MSNEVYTDPVTGKRYRKIKGTCDDCDFHAKNRVKSCRLTDCTSDINADLSSNIFKLIPGEGEAK